ncbi:hypothetical protein KL86DES1_10934 [uncultured Desulfovibrio sp.]|uniref:Uncharacterized protein n=1 Tax=uncultured Desulfovibrio sp. TaxID=167968 RepID=A0A212L0W2_9BACT|nr:hypothetical protein KL86DES1_10934 [uncultured Desulfovibrio sp.]VZH32806.1 conserved protein of unknown function [Desulfovibrio sp. 86]
MEPSTVQASPAGNGCREDRTAFSCVVKRRGEHTFPFENMHYQR